MGCDFVRGNPLFVITNYLSDAQREDMDLCWKNRKRGKADYVTCWYLKTGRYIQETGPDSSRYCPQCRHKKLEKSYENGYETEEEDDVYILTEEALKTMLIDQEGNDSEAF